MRPRKSLWQGLHCICGKNLAYPEMLALGAVFFSGCPMGCVFCQNHNIAEAKAGKTITVERLSEIFLELQEKGAANINLVTPTHYVLQIIEVLDLARKEGLSLPIVYNTSGYEKPETIRMLDGYVDVYLPDFKYMESELAAAYSGAPDYPKYAKAALKRKCCIRRETFRLIKTPV